jgi:pyruvate formate lyase activating enzyme
MEIGGLEKLTLIDYPGEVAAIIFTQGCNFRCHFCYNPMLVWPREVGELEYHQDHSSINQNDLFDFLQERIGRLDAVVITGGEPTLHPDLPEFLARIKKIGYKIKLDSNGTNPSAFLPLLTKERGGTRAAEEGDLIDYIAMDIKGPLDKYEQVVQCKVNLDNIQESIKIIKASGLPYEFRTTLVPGLHTLEDIAKMGELIQGADKWYLQFFKSDTPLVDRTLEAKDRFTHAEMAAMAEEGKKYVGLCEVRG